MSRRVAVVTGAASGIGLGIARQLAADGHAVALLDRSGDAAAAAAAELREQGRSAIGIAVDVSDWAAVREAFARVREQIGPVTILVTSAGIDSFDSILDITPEIWNRVVAVNLTGTFSCVQAAIPDMIAAGWGRIVTISSQSAQSGAPDLAHYAASKGGVIALTKTLARELAPHGITANTIPPALVDTPMARKAESVGDIAGVAAMAKMIPLGRPGTPDDIADACSFLCSDRAGYITGQQIGVNGGMYI